MGLFLSFFGSVEKIESLCWGIFLFLPGWLNREKFSQFFCRDGMLEQGICDALIIFKLRILHGWALSRWRSKFVKFGAVSQSDVRS